MTRAAELGDDILPEVMSVFTAESFAAQTDKDLRNSLPRPLLAETMATCNMSDSQLSVIERVMSRQFYDPDVLEDLHEDEGVETKTEITDSDYKLYVCKSNGNFANKTKWPRLQQFTALLIKRFHHNRRDYRSYFSQIILPSLFVCIAMACILTKPVMESLHPIQLTQSLYEPWSSAFIR